MSNVPGNKILRNWLLLEGNEFSEQVDSDRSRDLILEVISLRNLLYMATVSEDDLIAEVEARKGLKGLKQ